MNQLEIIWSNNKIIKLRIDGEDLWETTEIIVDISYESQFIKFDNEEKLVSFSISLVKGLVTNLLQNYIEIANKLCKRFGI